MICITQFADSLQNDQKVIIIDDRSLSQSLSPIQIHTNTYTVIMTYERTHMATQNGRSKESQSLWRLVSGFLYWNWKSEQQNIFHVEEKKSCQVQAVALPLNRFEFHSIGTFISTWIDFQLHV